MQYTNKGGTRGTKRGDRASRTSHYGNPIEEVADMTAKKTTKVGTPAKTTTYPVYKGSVKPSTQPKFPPVSDEVTVYGAKKFRTPYAKDEFTGFQGSKIPAYVFDIDGTLSTYGQGADKDALEWAKKLYAKDPKAVFLVITARDHGSFGYEASFNWLMKHFPYPFIGPFARAKDDPRYASEFKRELAQSFEDIGLYKILGAADDNEFVIKMWKQWAKDHFDDPKEFDLLECSYGSYSSWRNDLPSKGGTTYGSSSYGSYNKDEHYDRDQQKWVSDTRWNSDKKRNEIWIKGGWDKDLKKYVDGHWEERKIVTGLPPAGGTHRQAGEHKPYSWAADPADGKYKKVDEFIKDPTPEAFGRSLADDPAWKTYFDARSTTGAYCGPDWTEELHDLDELGGQPYSLQRVDLIAIVAKAFPGYSADELEDMSIDELRENAGIVNPEWSNEARAAYGSRFVEDDDQNGLFTAEQLGLTGTEGVEERTSRITARMDLEDEVWAEYRALHLEDVQEMDLVDLELWMEVAAFLTDEEKDELTNLQAALMLAGERYPVGGEIVDGEVVEDLDDDGSAPDTAALDVSEVLSEMNENDLPELPSGASYQVPVDPTQTFA